MKRGYFTTFVLLFLFSSFFLIRGVNAETIPPTWSNNQINNTVAGQPTLFSLLVNDETALNPNGQYIFSTNNTGTWVNDSAGNKAGYFGNNSIGSSSDNLDVNGIFGSQFNLSQSATITSVSAYTHYVTGMMFAIYNSSQNLVANSSTFVTSSSAAWNTRNISVSLPAGSYWLIGYYNASPQLPYIYYTSSSVPAVWASTGTFPNIPSSISGISKTTRTFSIYANYTTGGGGNFTTTPQSINSTKLLNNTLGSIVGYQWYLTDNSGNMNNTGIFTFITNSGPDTINPLVNLNTPVNNYNTSSQTIAFNATGSDNVNLSNMTLYGNWTGSWALNTTNTSPINNTLTTFSINNIPEGRYVWNVLVCDGSNNCVFNNSNRTFTVDRTSPSMNIPFYVNLTQKANTQNLTLNISLTDSLSGLTGSDCIININGTNTTVAVSSGWCNSTAISLTGLADGNYPINVYSNDTLNNVGVNNNYYVQIVSIDVIPPVVNLNTPINNYNTSSQTISFSATGSDNVNLSNMTLYGNWTGSWAANATNFAPLNNTQTTFIINSLPEGRYVWNVLACDNSSNCAFASLNGTFTVDLTAPSWFSNQINSTTAGQPVGHSVYWTENTGLSGYIFSFDNGTGTFVNDSFVSITGKTNWSNVTKIVNFDNNSAIRWKVWTNDTSNNWNATDIFTYYTVSFSYPQIGLSVIYPSGNTNVGQNQLFNISLNVTCISGDCGTVNASLINQGGLGQIYGLNFPGSGGVTKTMSFNFSNPISYPATYIWQVYPKQQSLYYTAFFYGNGNSFEGNNDYYGFHPYPTFSGDDHDWEIASPPGGDWVGNLVVYNQWYQQAAVVYKSANGSYTYNIFYYNWPDITQNITHIDTTATSPPTTPAITVADAPWNQGNEEWYGYMRDFQFYNGTLNGTQIAQEISSPGSVKTPWYLNINPTPTDISDKSGNSHNPSWIGSERPTLWSSNNTTQGGPIPPNSGNPFYTNSSNPITTSPLISGQSQIITFWINATGNINASYPISAFANITSNQSVSSAVVIGNITIQQPMTVPIITTQPQALVQATEGATATFTVAATGNPNPSYQWQENGINISGANSSNYTTPTLTMSDNDTIYDVIVYNSVGSVTSNSSLLIVTPLPVLLLQMTNPTSANPINVSSNQNISLYFNVTKDGVPITSGVGIPNVTIGNITATVIGSPLVQTSNNYQPSVIMNKTTDTGMTQPPNFSSAWDGSNSSQSCYSNITTSNNIYCRLTSRTSNAEVWLRMNFTIPANVSTISSIKITAEGGANSSSSSEDLAFLIANFSANNWSRFGNDSKTEVNRTATYTGNFGSIIKNGQLVLLFEGNALDNGESIFIDYVNVQINTSSGGSQQFSYTPNGWQANVTTPILASGPQDLTVIASYNQTLLNDTETGSIVYS